MRYLLKISYDGKNYSGFQIQKDKDTIQSRLENALTKVIGKDISIVASGRTDAGVSALEQICHFDVEEKINDRRTIGYANNCLPSDIRILDIYEVNEYKVGFKVEKLKRERIAFLDLTNLNSGEYRLLTPKEVKKLYSLTK